MNQPISPPLAKAIVVSWDTLLDTPQLQQLSLLFDLILLWPKSANLITGEQLARATNDLEFLRAHRIAGKIGIQLPFGIGSMAPDGKFQDAFGGLYEGADVILSVGDLGQADERFPGEPEVGRTLRHIASRLTYNGSPVAANVEIPEHAARDIGSPVLQLSLSKIPMPPPETPWEDILAFREDTENQLYLSRLRLWLQKQSREHRPASEIQDELLQLLSDYKRYMKIQHRKFGEGALSTVLISTEEAVRNLLSLNFGEAIKQVFEFRARRLALQESEFSAPGRDVAYFTRLSRLL